MHIFNKQPKQNILLIYSSIIKFFRIDVSFKLSINIPIYIFLQLPKNKNILSYLAIFIRMNNLLIVYCLCI